MGARLSHKAITFFERRPPPSFPRDRPRRSTRQCSRKWRCWQRRLRHGRRHGRHAPADVPEEKTRHALTAGLLRLHEDVDRLSPARVPPLHVHHHPRKRADSTFALTSPVRPRHFLTGDTCTHARRCLPDLWQISIWQKSSGAAADSARFHRRPGSLARRVVSAHARALRALVEADEEVRCGAATGLRY